MKRFLSGAPLLFLWCLGAFFSCDLENKADADYIKARSTGAIPRVEINFRPPGIKGCCWHKDYGPTFMIDGATSGTYWDWAWGAPLTFTDYPELGTTSNVITPETGHANYFNAASFINRSNYNNNRPCHFFTIDLGTVKYGVRQVEYYPRNLAGHITEYEIWVSDYPIGVDPQASSGAYLAAKGTWTAYVAAWFVADFTAAAPAGIGGSIPHARYIQVRSYRDGDGSGSFEICGMEVRAQIWGSYDGTISAAALVDAHTQGTILLASLSKASPYRPTLKTLLEGANARIAEAQIKKADTSLTEAQKLAYQQIVDAEASALLKLIGEAGGK